MNRPGGRFVHSFPRLDCVCAVAFLCVVLAGCGEPPEELGPVTGQVTFDGTPVSSAMILFQDDARGIHMTAKLDPEGRFKVSMAAGYGLPLGTYDVAIKPTVSRPGAQQGPAQTNTRASPAQLNRADIPQRYRDTATSGLSLTVERGGGEYPIQMKSP